MNNIKEIIKEQIDKHNLYKSNYEFVMNEWTFFDLYLFMRDNKMSFINKMVMLQRAINLYDLELKMTKDEYTQKIKWMEQIKKKMMKLKND